MTRAPAPPAPTVWLTDLRQSQLHLPERAARWHGAGLVSDGELATAARYAHGGAKMQYLAGRALVRHALARAAGYPPHQVRIVLGEAGKPALADTPDRQQWHFNISHSGDLVACVLARTNIGIDIETAARQADFLSIARTYFSDQEAAWIGAKPDRANERFVALWTIKEAYLKAVGIGLSVPVASVRASDIGLRSCRVRSPDIPSAKRWYCRLVKPAPAFWLAICGESALAPIRIARAAL